MSCRRSHKRQGITLLLVTVTCCDGLSFTLYLPLCSLPFKVKLRSPPPGSRLWFRRRTSLSADRPRRYWTFHLTPGPRPSTLGLGVLLWLTAPSTRWHWPQAVLLSSPSSANLCHLLMRDKASEVNFIQFSHFLQFGMKSRLGVLGCTSIPLLVLGPGKCSVCTWGMEE